MNNLKRYKEITGKEFIGNDYSIEKFQDSKAVSNLIKEIEKLEHYKHLYSEIKKQKDDVVEYINNNSLYEEEYDYDYEENPYLSRISDEQARTNLLRKLGEIDENN